MSITKIEWATHVWNPVTGCTKVSEGCRHCYAERVVERFGRIGPETVPGVHPVVHDFRVMLHPDRLDQPLHWRKPRRVFVCSMGDLFHEDVPDVFIRAVFTTMAAARAHTFLVLTKRPERMLYILDLWSRAGLTLREGCAVTLPNVWLGVSVENQATADERIPLLLQTPAAVRFVSCEPMLGPVKLWRQQPNGRLLNLGEVASGRGLDWVICGGESGPGARPMHPDWARSLRDQCSAAGVPFFFKQWGEWASPWRAGEALAESQGHGDASARKPFCAGCAVHRWDDGDQSWRIGKKAAGRELDGRTHEEFPGVSE